MKKLLLVPVLTFLFAFGEPVHTKTDVAMNFQKDDVTITFKVTPNDNMVLTTDNAPWRLTLANTEGLMVDRQKLSWGPSDFDAKAGQFVIKGKTKGAGTFTYALNSFVCTKDKKQCYPEVHKNKVTWSNGQMNP